MRWAAGSATASASGRGWPITCSSSLDANVVAGPLSIRAGRQRRPTSIGRSPSIDDELTADLALEGITPKELNESRQFLIGSMPRALETNAGIASFLQAAEFFGLGLDYDVRLPSLLAAVTLDEANAAARRVLDPDRRRWSSRTLRSE